MFELLSYGWVQRAVLAGIIVSLLASYYGVFIVQRRMSFLGSGLAHSAFGGVALGVFLGLEPLAVAVPFSVFISLGIIWLQKKTSLATDTIIGILFTISMAVGIVLLHQTDNFNRDAMTYLFGSLLAVSWADLAVASGVLLASLGTIPFWGRWSLATFDRTLAQAEGSAVDRDDYLLAAVLAVVTVLALKFVGITLITAFFVLPAATARLVSKSFAQMTVLSLIIGLVGTGLGLLITLNYDIPSGAAITLVQGGIFGVMFLVRPRR